MSDAIRRWVAVATLAVFAGAAGWTAMQWEGVRELQLVFGVIGIALFAAGVGVFCRQMLARWIGLAAGLAGLLNAVVFRAWFGRWTREALFFVAISLTVLAALGGRRMAHHFAVSLKPQSVFHRVGLRVELVRAAIVTGIAAIPTLMLVGAFPVAALLGVGVLAAWRERFAGVALLGVGGVSATMAGLSGAWSAHLLFPLLTAAGLCGVAANVALAKPVLAYLRRPA